MRAEHPHTELTTTIVVPFASASCASTSSGVRISVTPSRVRSCRIGADETLVVHLLGKSHIQKSQREL